MLGGVVRRPASTRWLPVAAVAGVLLCAVATLKVGPMALAGAAALIVAVALIDRPRLAVAVAVGAPVLFESDAEWNIPLMARLYAFVPGIRVTGLEVLLAIAVVAVLLQAFRTRRARTAGPLNLPLALLLLAMAAGAITGSAAGATGMEIFGDVRTFMPLVVLPLLVCNVVVDAETLRRALGFGATLAIAKAVFGLLWMVAGRSPVAVEGLHVTYLQSTANFLTMTFSLCVVAALLRRVPLTWWVRWMWPLTVASLVFSYRRSFWVATIAGVVVVVLAAIGRSGRQVLVPAVATVAIASYVLLSSSSLAQLNEPMAQPAGSAPTLLSRLQSLNPAAIEKNQQDQYRVEERRNVLAEIERAPVAGIGFSVPWRARYPLTIEHTGGRHYNHFAVLNFWLRMGILGALAYVALVLTAVVVALRIWRRASDGLVRAFGLGSAAGAIGLAIAELTATFIGSEIRMCVLYGAFLGLLGAASAVVASERGAGVREI